MHASDHDGVIPASAGPSPPRQVLLPHLAGTTLDVAISDSDGKHGPFEEVFEGTKDFFSRRGKRPQVDREHREFWEPDTRLVALARSSFS